MTMRGAAAIACLVATTAVSADTPAARAADAGAREAAQAAPPVFRGGATFVYVDAYPRRAGRVVPDLGAQDFQVFEDGKPQHIETFQYIASRPATPDASRVDPNTKEDGDRQAADPHNRVFVVYLDLYHTTVSGSHDARAPLLEFLDRTIGANDLFGVATPEVPPARLVFGRRSETLSAEMAKYWPWGLSDQVELPRTDEERTLVRDCGMRIKTEQATPLLLRLYREDALLTNLETLMTRLRDLRDERKNLLFVSEGWVPEPPHPELTTLETGDIPTVGVGPGGRIGIDNQPGYGGSPSACNTLIGRLATIDFARRFRDLLTMARRANVSVYPVDVGGLKTTPAHGARDTLLTLADNTDGLAVVDTNDLSAGFHQVAQSVEAYYLLGYYSTNTAHDGRFRTIDVKMTAPDVKVVARRGYLAPREAPATAAVPAEAASAAGILAALPQVSNETDVFGYGVAGPAGLTVVAEIARRQLDQGRWGKGAAVRAVVTSQTGSSVTGDGHIEAGARGALVRVPVDAADPGPWRVVVQVTGEGGALDVAFDVARRSGALLGQALAFRAQPSPRAPLDPVATFEYRRTERLHVEWPALRPVAQSQARLLDRRGQVLLADLPVTVREAPPDPAVVADFNLATFAEGEYIIEVIAGAGDAAERRQLAFRIVP